jgi:hypothetical protein
MTIHRCGFPSNTVTLRSRWHLPPDPQGACRCGFGERYLQDAKKIEAVQPELTAPSANWHLIGLLTGRHDLQQLIRQGPLQRDCFIFGTLESHVKFSFSREQHRHGIGVNWAQDVEFSRLRRIPTPCVRAKSWKTLVGSRSAYCVACRYIRTFTPRSAARLSACIIGQSVRA